MSLKVLESKEYCIGFPYHCIYSFFIEPGNQRILMLRRQSIKSIPVETYYVISTKKLQTKAKFYSYDFCKDFCCHMA